jgi:hypothetical protein
MASKRAQRRRACGHKVKHATEAEAKSAIRRMHEQGSLGMLVPYRCRYCGAFHVGHPPHQVRQAMAARGRL